MGKGEHRNRSLGAARLPLTVLWVFDGRTDLINLSEKMTDSDRQYRLSSSILLQNNKYTFRTSITVEGVVKTFEI